MKYDSSFDRMPTITSSMPFMADVWSLQGDSITEPQLTTEPQQLVNADNAAS